MDLWVIRIILILSIVVSASFVRPFSLDIVPTIVISAALGVLIILAELRIRRASLKTLIGAALGSILGIAGASLISLVIGRMQLSPSHATFA
jgi:hypothetical protein